MLYRLLVATAVCLTFSGFSWAQEVHYSKSGPALLQNSETTPGAVRLSSKTTVCSIKWGKDERHVTEKMKQSVYAQYRAVKEKGICCEVDHLISRELGGDDAMANLWPQPYSPKPGAHEKDWLENELHKEVCAGDISLADAQKEIAADWYAAYSRREHLRKP